MLELFNTNEDSFKQNNESSMKKIKITEKLRSKIDETTQHLIKSNYPYDALCWALAEFQIIFEKEGKKYSEHEVIEREKNIFNAALDYDEICFFIANLKVYLEEVKLYP
jgi:hypothetical protein